MTVNTINARFSTQSTRMIVGNRRLGPWYEVLYEDWLRANKRSAKSNIFLRSRVSIRIRTLNKEPKMEEAAQAAQ